MEVKSSSRRAGAVLLFFTLAFLVAPFFLSVHTWTLHPYPVGPKVASIFSRALSFEAATEKGVMLTCLLQTTSIDEVQVYLDANKPGQVATSPWTNFAAIAANGWVQETSADEPIFDADDYTDIFGVNPDNNVYIKWLQETEVIFNGIDYPPSGGEYGNLYNAQGGLIAADFNYAPSFEVAPSRSSTSIVPLKQWSDIVFLTWQQQCSQAGVDVGSLTKVFRITISNKDSLALITQAVQLEGGTMDDTWDNKVRMPVGSVGFSAILGSPNGYGVAWLLIQHRDQMGHLTINAVSYFTEDGSQNLFFELGPYTG